MRYAKLDKDKGRLHLMGIWLNDLFQIIPLDVLVGINIFRYISAKVPSYARRIQSHYELDPDSGRIYELAICQLSSVHEPANSDF